MGKNADLFLSAFIEIEGYLKKTSNARGHQTFSTLAQDAARKSAVVRRYLGDLKQYGELRNAIVHTQSADHRVLAEPFDSTVHAIQGIVKQLLRPPVVDEVCAKPVLNVSPHDSIAHAMSLMSQRWISQLPVITEGACQGVLSSQTVVRWLGAKVTDDVLSLSESKVSEALPYKEKDETCLFVGRKVTLAEILELFQEEASNGRELSAILVTQSGKKTESLFGIVTASDFPVILRKLGYR